MAKTEGGVVEVGVTANLESGESVTATFDLELGTSASEAVEKFGDELVFDHFVRSVKVRAQAVARSLIVAGKGEEEIREFFVTWRPDTTRTPIKDPVASITKNFASLTAEQKAELLKMLKGL